MQKVVILEEREYEDLIESERSLSQLLKELEELIDKPEELRAFIADKLDIE